MKVIILLCGSVTRIYLLQIVNLLYNLNSAERRTAVENTIIPVLPLRGLVVYPNMVINLDALRPVSCSAVEYAFINKKKIDITKFNSIVWSDEKYINNMERVFNLLESNQRDIDITQFDCDVFYFNSRQ